MATILIAISDDEEQEGQVNVHMDAKETIPEEHALWTPAQVMASHLHDHITTLRYGISAEVARRRRHH